MQLLKRLFLLGFLAATSLITVRAQVISAAEASIHIGERETVCGLVLGKHLAISSAGRPTFVDLDKAYPNQPLTVVVWERDRGKVGDLPGSGRLCVTGTVTEYHSKPEIVLHEAAGWSIPKAQIHAPSGLSNDRHYVNTDGQIVHSPAHSSTGIPAGATAVCGDGSYSFSRHRSGTCAHHGGVSRWL